MLENKGKKHRKQGKFLSPSNSLSKLCPGFFVQHL